MITVDTVVDDYLRRMDRAAAELPENRRQELLDGIREHIAAARAAGAADEAAVRTLLDRLGQPEEIVAAARDDEPEGGASRPPAHAGGAAATHRGTTQELAAVLLLTAGSFLPVVGWLAGVVLLWSSDLWRLHEKVLGTSIVPLGPGGLLIFGGMLPLGPAETCTTTIIGSGSPQDAPSEFVCTTTGPPSWFGPVLFAVLIVASLAVAVLLLRTARRRAETNWPQGT